MCKYQLGKYNWKHDSFIDPLQVYFQGQKENNLKRDILVFRSLGKEIAVGHIWRNRISDWSEFCLNPGHLLCGTVFFPFVNAAVLWFFTIL